MKFYFPFLPFLLNCFLSVHCFKTNTNFKLIYNIHKIGKRKHTSGTRLYSSSEHIKRLKYVREVTNASIQICNNALKECNSDVEKAIELVRKNTKNCSFVSTNIKTQKEGLVTAGIENDSIVLLEVLTDSDFVSHNEKFLNFVKGLLNTTLANDILMPSLSTTSDVYHVGEANEYLLSLPYADPMGNVCGTVGEQLNYLRNIFREDIKIGRFAKYTRKKENEFFHFYIHNIVEGDLGLSGVLLVINIERLDEKLERKKEHIVNIANDLAMHILSAKPATISIDGLSDKIVQREMDIIRESLSGQNKPDNIINNMVNGKMKKFYSSIVLLEQEYMLDDTKRKVSQVIAEFSKKHDINLSVQHFDNFIIGEKNILKE
ncbi:elongation factor (EF-TS), putative (EF-Ts) [Plasmodium ovale wallikeri]|uniref:Elongation factor Ts, mitochondrial n=1 Tax=Plasmodium ovale wallikeri TaxID=864142 RepID=A0A1A8YTZ7_PLAOA|nr:elongation factor (EF-TS), putative (EF-Ts) [Plasmodium ovale wallikeri]